MRTATMVFSLLVLVGIACLLPAESKESAMPQSPPANASAQLAKILTDRTIWGDDAFQAFASIDRWKSEGETSILVFTDKVVGATGFETPEQAKEKAARMALAMNRAHAGLSPEFATLYRAVLTKKVPALQVESARFLEDDSYRLQWKREGAEFFKRQLTFRAVVDAYGPPEKTTTEVVHSHGDRRPAVLTISEYADGKVKFVQSDVSPDPTKVDRVILDISAVAARVLAPSR